jgi:hypothetical protein
MGNSQQRDAVVVFTVIETFEYQRKTEAALIRGYPHILTDSLLMCDS